MPKAPVRPPWCLVGIHTAGKTAVAEALSTGFGFRSLPEIGKSIYTQFRLRGRSCADGTMDQMILERELERDHSLARLPDARLLIETWHPGNLAYARTRVGHTYYERAKRFYFESPLFPGRCLLLKMPPVLIGTRPSDLPGTITEKRNLFQNVAENLDFVLIDLRISVVVVDAAQALQEVVARAVEAMGLARANP